MLLETFSVMRDLPRLHEITSVMIHHGLGDVMHRIGVISLLERAGQILRRPKPEKAHEELETPQRIRLAFEQLGPTFTKLGQLLATRSDVFPPEWIAEFEKLQDSAPPVPFDKLLPTIEKALGRSPFNVFRELQTEPTGSASIAQVHRATLMDGTQVALKIRRPGIRPKIDADLRILHHIATLIESEIPESRRYQPVQVAREFARSLLRELDLAVEARNQERFRRNFASDPDVIIPRIYWEWTSPHMNVQEYVSGYSGHDLAAIDDAGLDRKLLAKRGADAVLKMILVDGFFHADPHPGNVFYLPGNRLVLLDFGMVGHLTDQRRNQLVDLFASLARGDEHGMLEVLLDWTENGDVNETRMFRDVNELISDYEYRTLKDIRMGELLRDITNVMRGHSIVLPPDLTLLFKALITLEGLGFKLDPEFNIGDHLAPFLEKVIIDRRRPAAVAKRGRQQLHDLISQIGGLPGDAARLLREARLGRVKIDLDIKRLDHFGHQLDHSTDRLTVGVLTAALIVGSSIVMTVKGGPELFGLPLFGFVGYLIAFVNCIWIVLSIWRTESVWRSDR
jgi:ubiquinone biosynthesis protein